MNPLPFQAEPPMLRVAVEINPGDVRRQEFQTPFRIGRVEECGLCVKSEYVSRNHAEARFENGVWVIRDSNSANGLFVDGLRVSEARVDEIGRAHV